MSENNKILIIHLDRSINVLSVNHITNSIKQNHDNPVQITLLTQESNRNLFEYFFNVDQFKTIDVAALKNINKSELFLKSFSINKYYGLIKDLTNTSWDQIVLSSQNQYTVLLASIFDEQKINRYYLNNQAILKYNSDWSIIENLHINNKKDYFFHPIELNHFSNNIPINREIGNIEFEPQATQIVKTHFDAIRNEFTVAKGKKLIGICLSSITNTLDLADLHTLIKQINEKEDYHVILITREDNTEFAISDELCLIFNEQITSITVDPPSIPAVLQEFDFIITGENVFSYLCSFLQIANLELKIDRKVNFSTSFHNGSYAIIVKEASPINKILAVFDYHFNKQEIDSNINDIYINDYNELGYFNINRPNNEKEEILVKKIIARQAVWPNQNNFNLSHLSNNIKTALFDELKIVSSSILQCLRHLKTDASNSNRINHLFNSLETLIATGDRLNFLSISTTFFKGQIENINNESNQDTILHLIESSLYELKDSLKTIQNALTSVATNEESSQKNKIVERNL